MAGIDLSEDLKIFEGPDQETSSWHRSEPVLFFGLSALLIMGAIFLSNLYAMLGILLLAWLRLPLIGPRLAEWLGRLPIPGLKKWFKPDPIKTLPSTQRQKIEKLQPKLILAEQKLETALEQSLQLIDQSLQPYWTVSQSDEYGRMEVNMLADLAASLSVMAQKDDSDLAQALSKAQLPKLLHMINAKLVDIDELSAAERPIYYQLQPSPSLEKETIEQIEPAIIDKNGQLLRKGLAWVGE